VHVSWRDPDGRLRQRSRSVHGGRREAERVRDELRHRRHRTGLEQSDETFVAVLREWLDLREPMLSPSTVDVYDQAIRQRLAPALGTMRVAQITARHLDRYYAALHEEGLVARRSGA
jgi:hypothetical protein